MQELAEKAWRSVKRENTVGKVTVNVRAFKRLIRGMKRLADHLPRAQRTLTWSHLALNLVQQTVVTQALGRWAALSCFQMGSG
jgi:hypothetical protein